MTNTQREKGQFFTPENMVKEIIVNLSKFFLKFPGSINVLEPSAGEGVFCKEFIKYNKEKFSQIKLDTLDIDSAVLTKAESNLLPLFKDSSHMISILKKNFLTEFDPEINLEKYDLILGNPPHNAKYTIEEWREIRTLDHKFPSKKIPKESALYFFLKGLMLLKPGGIISFILPKPFSYSNRWKIFRELCFTQYRLLEIYDLSNQFSGQLQEQLLVIIQESKPNASYLTGVWDPKNKKLIQVSNVELNLAIGLDNFLLGVTKREQKLIKKLESRSIKIKWNAFRGLNSAFRTINNSIPLIEKSTIANGFLMPSRHYVASDVPEKTLKRLLQPKIIVQRIIPYQTQPKFRLNLQAWIDLKGELITHETVINLIPPQGGAINLYGFGGLLQSTFVEWWLQHAIYTKIFCTSKDLDKPYLNKLIFPKLDGKRDSNLQKSLVEVVKNKKYSQILQLLKSATKYDQFYALGMFFQEYLRIGDNFKQKIDSLMNFMFKNKKTGMNEYYRQFKKIISLVQKNDKDLIYSEFIDSLDLAKEKIIEDILLIHTSMEEIKLSIDQIVFNLYELSPTDIKIISEGN